MQRHPLRQRKTEKQQKVEIPESCAGDDGGRQEAVLTRRLIQGDDQRLKCIKCLQLSLRVRVQVLEQDRQPLLDDGRVHAAVAVVICG